MVSLFYMDNIRTALPDEANALSILAIKAKAFWGYSDEFMRACTEELSHTPEQINKADRCYNLLLRNNKIIGFYQLEAIHCKTIVLDALFISPEYIGQGAGKQLFDHAVKVSKNKKAQFLTTQSDPNAEDFYLKMGMTVTGRQASGSIVGRSLPTLSLTL